MIFFLFSSSRLFFFSLLSLQLLHFIILDLSQTWQFAHYHKIMGCGYWEDPGKTWPQNITITCAVFFLLFILYFFFLSFSSFLFQTPANSWYDQTHCSDIPHSQGLHSLSGTLVSIIPPPPHLTVRLTQSQVMENLASNWNYIHSIYSIYCLVVCLQWLWKGDGRVPPLPFSPLLSSAITPTNDASPSPQAANTKL